MKILFLVPYPLKEAPSQRFRFEQYFEVLFAHGHQVEVCSFLTSHNWRLFFQSGNFKGKALALLSGFYRRFSKLFTISHFDVVFIHREAAPLGPPVIEWFISSILQKAIIYDFDDAIWLRDKENENRFITMLKWRSKVKSICRWSYKVSCGNEFLGDFARQFNSRTIINPTTIDTDHLHNKRRYNTPRPSDKITIGWTGSHSTLRYLHTIIPVLQQLEKKYPHLLFLVIADRQPLLELKSFQFIPWSTASEIEGLIKMDIGIMPLENDLWSKGKCGFKALQYMAMEIPAVVSPVGVNLQIVTEGVDGYLCETDLEWYEKLSKLIEDHALRNKMGQQARRTVEENYSVTSNTPVFLSLFD